MLAQIGAGVPAGLGIGRRALLRAGLATRLRMVLIRARLVPGPGELAGVALLLVRMPLLLLLGIPLLLLLPCCCCCCCCCCEGG